MYEKLRVNVKVEPRSTFTFTFTRVKNYATVEIHLLSPKIVFAIFPDIASKQTDFFQKWDLYMNEGY